MIIYTPFVQNTSRLSFILSQNFLTLSKFIGKIHQHLWHEISFVNCEHIWWKPQPSWKPAQIIPKKSQLNLPKITHVDNMMIHNLIKYLVQTRLYLWDIKIRNFKPESCPNDLLEICYFYISQTKSSLDKIFCKLCIIISSICVILLVNLYDFLLWFARVFTKIAVSTRYVPQLESPKETIHVMAVWQRVIGWEIAPWIKGYECPSFLAKNRHS